VTPGEVSSAGRCAEETEQGSAFSGRRTGPVSVSGPIHVDWAGFWADSGRQIPAWFAGKNGRSCAPPGFYTVSCRN
jgi:hypothetical protein